MLPIKRFDERDIMFSRMGLKPGTPEYDDYYGRNPDKKEQDDRLRSLPDLGSEGTLTYDGLNSPIINAAFRFLSDIKQFSEGTPEPKRVNVNPEVMTRRIKGLATYYGAKLVGITEMKEYHYYSHRGRIAESYGEEISEFHKYGIAFAVEMDKEMVFRAPGSAEGIAVTKGYVDAAIIGMVLSYYIRELGYEARNHMDGNYLVVAPLVARDAGLGEMGRSGLLLTRDFGPRVRLGVVTTDMPLECDDAKPVGLSQLCDQCRICARMCPARAIPAGEQMVVDGEKRWRIDQDACYRNWRCLGGDCGICLAVCPLSDNVPRELVDGIPGSPEARQEILANHHAKHGTRPFSKNDPGWLR